MNKITAFAFDLDGTLYKGSVPIKGARQTVARLIELGMRVFYFTNNSARTRQELVEKLTFLGFPASKENTYCTSYAIKKYLLEKKIKDIYLIGTDSLRCQLKDAKIKIRDSALVQAVVVGLDPFFTYAKISKALEAINRGAKLIVANDDPSYPVENNRRLPGCGAMVGAIVGASLHKPDFTVGKPHTYMLEILCKDHNLSHSEICVVGDSLQSDIKMAENLKCASILFDPKGWFPYYKGKKAKEFGEIISIIKK